jgi:Ca2+/Na+ antiporter
MMLNVANRLRVSDIAYGVLFLACTIIMTLVVTAMCAVAYRESTRGVKAA